MTQPATAMARNETIAIEMVAIRTMRRPLTPSWLLTPSWPGLSWPSTSSLSAATKVVDGRDIRAKTRFALLPGHDDVERLRPDALISPDAPRPIRYRCGHNARDCTYPRHRPAAARICPATPRAPHRPP